MKHARSTLLLFAIAHNNYITSTTPLSSSRTRGASSTSSTRTTILATTVGQLKTKGKRRHKERKV